MTAPTPQRRRPRRTRAIPIAHLRDQCTTAEFTLRSLDPATRDFIEAWRPGGAENPSEDAFAWLGFFRVLHREVAVREQTPARAQTGAPAEDAIVTAALANEPVRVPASVVDESGNRCEFLVYPKSFSALLHLMGRDACLGLLARDVARIAVVGSAEQLDAHVRALDEMDYQQRVCAWIVCTAGPGLPFDWAAATPVPPEWTRSLDSSDFMALIGGHQRVNRERLAYLRALIEPDDGESPTVKRPSWAVLFATLGTEFRERPENLMRDRSLAELLAQLRLSSAAKKEAMEAARVEAERKRSA